MIRIGSALTAVCCMVLLTGEIHAQNPTFSPTTLATTSRTRWCFRGHPKPDCDVFWLTEFGVAARAADNRPYESGPLATWELGWMLNRGTSRAIGIAAFAQVGDGVEAVGIRPRLRFWLSPTTSLDLAPGIVAHGSGPAPGFSGHIGIGLSDIAAVTAHLVALRPYSYDDDRSTRTALFVGGRLGSEPGTIVGVGGPVIVIIAFLFACGSGNCFD